MDMNYVDVPGFGTPAVLVAAAPAVGKEKAMGVCLPTEQIRKDVRQPLIVQPDGSAQSYFDFYEKKKVSPSFGGVRVVRRPLNGQLKHEKNASGFDVYAYYPEHGYLGKDRFEFVVSVGKESVRVVYFVVVQPNRTDEEGFQSRKFCPKVDWKISLDTGSDANLQALLAQSLASGLNVTTADLGSAMLGQTTGTGADAQITLDTDAAG